MQPGSPQPPEQPAPGQPYGSGPGPSAYPGQPGYTQYPGQPEAGQHAGQPDGSQYPGQPLSPYPGAAPGGFPHPGPGAYPEQGSYGQQVPPYNYGAYPPPKSGGGGKKAVLIVLIVVVAVGLLTAGGFGAYALLSKDKTSSSTASSHSGGGGKEYAKLGNPKNLSQSDLDKLDKHALFMETFRNMMLQSSVRTVSETVLSQKADLSEGFSNRTDAGFDYKTKKFSLNRENTLQTGKPGIKGLGFKTRCVDGKSYSFSEFEKKWNQSRFDSCQLRDAIYAIGDGIDIFGLDEKQADAVSQYFTKDFPDVIQVPKLELKTKPGDGTKKYLRFEVNFTPVKSGPYGYFGLQHFTWAFQRAGIDYKAHPYSAKGGLGQGLHVVFYVDPSTGLPVYSQQSNIPTFDAQGKPRSIEDSKVGYRDDRYQYSFGKEFPQLDMNATSTITLDWPRDNDAGWKPPSDTPAT